MNPTSSFFEASGPALMVLWLLLGATVAVWTIAFVKIRQLARVGRAQRAFEKALDGVHTVGEAEALCSHHRGAPGAHVLVRMVRKQGSPALLEAVAESGVTAEREALSSFMPTLSTIAAAAPFVGLLGTVWGILDAFLRIGQQRATDLTVVAPAIGEALVATAMGLFAAIPAVVAYNYIGRRIGDELDRLRATARVWAQTLASRPE
ncbi:MotA/TolQ/ExbB proton channel family protein [Paraliomyxa miuraensis]|uniref:MotA/TolQ/ExbB proton channel family protein n=1 Tax=Paraliomyxa miuraensis TaxID=376150 RepID=UPI0022599148|nr:MotA/TolQ/ExbB proton channel family protein [Paraliomyxa miuraensis]MCX4244080.1 MotA/TolQ/ExbB proton channel family protein [Paraliomyxa miuraensis]